MEYVIVVITAFAIWHWWYEAIFAPSLRLELRFRLFRLRDEVRDLKIQLGDKLDDKHFHFLQDATNNGIRLLPRFDIAMLVRTARILERDPELRARAAARSKVLDDCKFSEVVNIRKRTIEILSLALSANSGGWIPYLIPIALAIGCYKKTEALVKSLAALSESDLQSIAPNTVGSTVPA